LQQGRKPPSFARVNMSEAARALGVARSTLYRNVAAARSRE